ncbi:MAG: hypothetical protein NFCOHLIN_00218 [Gammaproteobacteria bacterium]|nr:hypothetical protein [Gammaproteobacteria bacterium]
MTRRNILGMSLWLVSALGWFAAGAVRAQGSHAGAAQEERAAAATVPAQALAISPELRELLREEMRGISKGMEALVTAIATGDWKMVTDTSARIRASYIMEQRLTAAQKDELETELPEVFKLMDANFHREAGNLGHAAEVRDAELTSFYFYRMVESCVACHSAYATTRFPNLVTDAPPEAREH